MLKKSSKTKHKKKEPIASNVVNQIFSKVEEENEPEPEPASMYEDEYAEYKEDTENDTDAESVVSLESGISNKEDVVCLEDEEYNNQYSFISKVNQTIKKPVLPSSQLKFDEYEEES